MSRNAYTRPSVLLRELEVRGACAKARARVSPSPVPALTPAIYLCTSCIAMSGRTSGEVQPMVRTQPIERPFPVVCLDLSDRHRDDSILASFNLRDADFCLLLVLLLEGTP